MASKMPRSASGVAPRIARDQLGVIEIIPGIHAHPPGKAPPHGNLLVLVEERNLHPVDLCGICADHIDGDIHRARVVLRAPIAVQRRIEHLAEPMDDHGLAHLAEDAAIDLGVVVRRARRLHQRAARHQHDAAAEFLDRGALLLVGGDDVPDGDVGARVEMIGPRTASDEGARHVFRRGKAPADQLERCGPIQPHAALRGIHRLGDAETERPEVAAEGDGALPVDRGIEPRIGICYGIGHDMRGRIGDAVERRLRGREISRRTRGIGREPAAGDGKIERGHLFVTLVCTGRAGVRPQRYRTSLTHAPPAAHRIWAVVPSLAGPSPARSAGMTGKDCLSCDATARCMRAS